MINEIKNDQPSQATDIAFLKQQIARLTGLLQDKDKKIAALTSRISEESSPDLSTSLSKGKLQMDEYSPNDTNKEIVKLYAYGNSPAYIYRLLNEQLGKSVSLDIIEKLAYNLTHDPFSVDIDLIDYFNKCKKVFEEQKITKGLFANSILGQLQMIEESYNRLALLARENGDIKEERLVNEDLVKLMAQKSQIFSKNVLGVFETGTISSDGYDEEYKKLKAQYESDDDSQNKKILKIKRG